VNTVALVGMNGLIDFMCYPEFDSPRLFASLLDHEKGGFFQIAMHHSDAMCKQIYLPDTNVLITRFLSEEGVIEITDFMPVSGIFKDNVLIRRVSFVCGNNKIVMRCAPKFNYGKTEHRVLHQVKSILFMSEGLGLKLQSNIPMKIDEQDATAEFILKPGDEVDFVLGRIAGTPPEQNLSDIVEQSLNETIQYWRRWIGNSTYKGRWQEEIHRSALLLKLMTAIKYGSIVAAATFGLPEQVGGNKN
jgi:GH15 family glucan-1,4-alpha-glucosidase